MHLSGCLKETPIRCRRIKTEDHAIILVTKNEKETAPWTGESRITQGRTQEAGMEMTHKRTEKHICLRTMDKKIVMIHAADMAKI